MQKIVPESSQILRVTHGGVKASSPGYVDIKSLTRASTNLGESKDDGEGLDVARRDSFLHPCMGQIPSILITISKQSHASPCPALWEQETPTLH